MLDTREVQAGYLGSIGRILVIPVKYRLDSRKVKASTREVQSGYQGSTCWIPGKYRLDTRKVLVGYQGSTG